MISNKRLLACLLVISIGLIQSASAESVKSYNCPVTLKVLQKNELIALGKPQISPSDSGIPAIHNLVLKTEADLDNHEECVAYNDVKEFHMNNVQQHDPAFQALEEGDVITGTLNYHRPSPHGKMLYENFHHGFRLLTVKIADDDNVSEDHSDKYTYFRHIGTY